MAWQAISTRLSSYNLLGMTVLLLSVMMRDGHPLVSVDVGEPVEDAVHDQLPVQRLLGRGGEEGEVAAWQSQAGIPGGNNFGDKEWRQQGWRGPGARILGKAEELS